MKTSTKVLHWAPRILCMVAILFISLFAGDAFEHGDTMWEKLGAFVRHLIPSFVLLIFLLVAWKWEFFGGLLFMAIGLGFAPYIFLHNHQSLFWSLVAVTFINLPFVIVGILFLVSHSRKKKQRQVALS